MVELETEVLHEGDDLEAVYRLGRALYDVGIPSFIEGADGRELPSADEAEAPAAGEAGDPPFRLSIYPQDAPLARDIVEETFGAG